MPLSALKLKLKANLEQHLSLFVLVDITIRRSHSRRKCETFDYDVERMRVNFMELMKYPMLIWQHVTPYISIGNTNFLKAQKTSRER